jgi:hypothetical protein
MEKARPGLQRLVAQLRPGGLLMLILPSFEWLRSEHDVATHILERYVAADVRRLLQDLDLSVELLTYRVCLMFPALVMRRLTRRGAGKHRPVDETRSDMHDIPGPVPNAIFLASLELENRALASGFRWPWGSSVFAVGRKRR